MDLNHRIEQWLTETQNEFHASARELNAPPRPHVTLSYAQSLDGSITTCPGETLTLSNETSTQLTHQLRSLHDGILVGIGTVLADDPRLTVREWPGPSPRPIVLDSHLRMPETSRLCQRSELPCWIVTTVAEGNGLGCCESIRVAGDEAGQVDLTAALAALYARNIRSLMVEGGASVISAFLRTRLADAVVLTIAPLLVGGYHAVEPLKSGTRQAFPRVSPLGSQPLGDDVIVWGRLRYGDFDA